MKEKYSEELYKKKVHDLYNGEVEVISRFKGMFKPILVKDKYGILSYQNASNVLTGVPSIKAALNKTEYFYAKLKDKHPEIADKVIPQTEYEAAKKEMLFMTQFGVVKSTPDALLSGHMPTIRSAINRKEYFKNQLLFLYGDKYDFEITSTDRHKGRVTLICPIHGKQSIDSDSVFLGVGCPECNKSWEKSNVFYLIRLHDSSESFFKLGISYLKNGKVRRFGDYEKLGYSVDPIKVIEFNDFLEARQFEQSLKNIIKPNLYTPKRWEAHSSTECFSDDFLSMILSKLKQDIVSTSTETQSSLNKAGED